MFLLVIAVGLGFAIRAVVAPNQPTITVRLMGLLGVAFLVQTFVAAAFTGIPRRIALGVSVLAAIGWLVGNLVGATSRYVRAGLLVFAIGAAMNAVPIAQYGRMPVDRQALQGIGFSDKDNTGFRATKHLVVDHAPFLGDRFAIPALRTVASLGDFVEMAGVSGLISVVPKRRRSTRLQQATVA
jgi:Family of unknown function (DUF5317)